LKIELKVLEIVRREAIEIGMRIGRGINSVLLKEKTFGALVEFLCL
jgi:DNA polymerase elongation subunit (family B)